MAILRIRSTSLTLVLSLAVPFSATAEGIAISHDGVGCVVAEKFPRLEARLDPADRVADARLHFRPAGAAHWYSVPMRAAGTGTVFEAALPKPRKTLKAFDYYVSATDKALNSSQTEEFHPLVVSGPGACQDKKVAGTLVTAVVTLQAPAGAPVLPSGFGSQGVVAAGAAGAVAGTAAVAGAAVAAPVAGGGIGTTALVVGGLAVAGAGVAVAASSGGGESGAAPTTATGGGASACVDRGFVYAATFGAVGNINCAGPFQDETHRLTNNSCTALVVTSYPITSTYTCTGAPGSTRTRDDLSRYPQLLSIAPAQTGAFNEIPGSRYGVPEFGGAFDCQFPGEGGQTCTLDYLHTVVTNKGTQSQHQVFAYSRASCPPCPLTGRPEGGAVSPTSGKVR